MYLHFHVVDFEITVKLPWSTRIIDYYPPELKIYDLIL